MATVSKRLRMLCLASVEGFCCWAGCGVTVGNATNRSSKPAVISFFEEDPRSAFTGWLNAAGVVTGGVAFELPELDAVDAACDSAAAQTIISPG